MLYKIDNHCRCYNSYIEKKKKFLPRRVILVIALLQIIIFLHFHIHQMEPKWSLGEKKEAMPNEA